MLDSDGDAANTGTGFGKPSKDLSVNFVPVPYPDYPPAALAMKPGERQLWRVLNASAITYLNLALLVRRAPQTARRRRASMACRSDFGGSPSPPVQWVEHIGVPPGCPRRIHRRGTAAKCARALLVTRAVDTGPAGENDPNRALVAITALADAREPQAALPAHARRCRRRAAMGRRRRARARAKTFLFRATGEPERSRTAPPNFF